jgi:succinate dehydrogenase/fumarate reductase flavoprotein subunit
MKQSTISLPGLEEKVSFTRVHTLVVGSGAAGLNAAVQLHAEGVTDLLILTEGLEAGTSINTGSDKQTYYKLGMYGVDKDSPSSLADSFFAGGSMHGDLALVEAALSARAFLSLVNLGVPFPRDRFGQFVGYKTDHDPLQRATSVGPYTSREMCRCLIREVRRRRIAVSEGRVAVALLTVGEGDAKRACGVIAARSGAGVAPTFEIHLAENVVFAVGGPGGLYRTSVYPQVHTGAIGLALLAGAKARNLPDAQYGMASTTFRWNVSGTYMQVVPRFISTAADGVSDEAEFLLPYFAGPGAMNSAIFLKGYQWPFDPRKVVGGSSLIDILVYIETVIKGRRVFLDYRRNGAGFSFAELSPEAHGYLENSGALFGTPLERLAKMNQPAIDLYADHGIDLVHEPLEIAVCAQHNNGGLAGNLWWESENIRRLFPLGEVNGSHGVYRPGGSALNSGQVAGFRAAEYIAHACREPSLDVKAARQAAKAALGELCAWLGAAGGRPWQEHREALQARMSRAAAHIRSPEILAQAVAEAWGQWREIRAAGGRPGTAADAIEVLRNRQLVFAHAVYLEAVRASVAAGVGSRGSALVLAAEGSQVHSALGADWRFAPEDVSFKEQVLETVATPDGKVVNAWCPRRPIPASDAWFENAWAAFRNGEIYGENPKS